MALHARTAMRTPLIFLLSLAACTAKDDGDEATTTATSDTTATSGGFETDADPGDPDVLVGSFQVQLVAASGDSAAKTTILGKIYDGPTPAAIVWEPGTVVGACTLQTPRVPFCATSCGGSAVCVEDDTCEPYPVAHGAGTVTARGIELETGETEFTMSPIANNYQPGGTTKLAYPPFAAGDVITFEAAGDYFPPFTLESTGVAALALMNDAITLEQDTPIDLRWTAGTDASKVRVKLDISHHGGTRGMITCESADTGALTIDGALIGELLDLGIAGYPTIIVTREAIGAATITAGRVELVVSSSIEQAVQIPGLTSCTADEECSDGQTCQPDLTCQ